MSSTVKLRAGTAEPVFPGLLVLALTSSAAREFPIHNRASTVKHVTSVAKSQPRSSPGASSAIRSLFLK